MRRLTIACLVLLPLAAPGCGSGPAAPADGAARAAVSGAVTVAREAGGVRLTNGTGEPVAYAVWNAGWLALFGPCTDDGPDCPRLAAGASVLVPDQAVGGYAADMRELLVRWWHVLPDGAGGRRAGEVHEVVVRR